MQSCMSCGRALGDDLVNAAVPAYYDLMWTHYLIQHWVRDTLPASHASFFWLVACETVLSAQAPWNEIPTKRPGANSHLWMSQVSWLRHTNLPQCPQKHTVLIYFLISFIPLIKKNVKKNVEIERLELNLSSCHLCVRAPYAFYSNLVAAFARRI